MTVLGYWAPWSIVIVASMTNLIVARRTKRVISQVTIDPRLCSCGHGRSKHDRTGSCQEQVARPHYNAYGSRSGKEYVKCACLHFDGPPTMEDILRMGGAGEGS